MGKSNYSKTTPMTEKMKSADIKSRRDRRSLPPAPCTVGVRRCVINHRTVLLGLSRAMEVQTTPSTFDMTVTRERSPTSVLQASPWVKEQVKEQATWLATPKNLARRAWTTKELHASDQSHEEDSVALATPTTGARRYLRRRLTREEAVDDTTHGLPVMVQGAYRRSCYSNDVRMAMDALLHVDDLREAVEITHAGGLPPTSADCETLSGSLPSPRFLNELPSPVESCRAPPRMRRFPPEAERMSPLRSPPLLARDADDDDMCPAPPRLRPHAMGREQLMRRHR